MRGTFKAVILTVIPVITFALGAAPAFAIPQQTFTAMESVAAIAPVQTTQSILTSNSLDDLALSTITEQNDFTSLPHSFDVEAAIFQAESEVGTSRATGWNQAGECIVSTKRWIESGGGVWAGSGDPVSSYAGAIRLSIRDAKPGDIIQYEHIMYPTSWIAGVHTVMVTEVHEDGTFTIIESNNPGGSGLVVKNTSWTPAPPAGFQAVVWRF